MKTAPFTIASTKGSNARVLGFAGGSGCAWSCGARQVLTGPSRATETAVPPKLVYRRSMPRRTKRLRGERASRVAAGRRRWVRRAVNRKIGDVVLGNLAADGEGHTLAAGVNRSRHNTRLIGLGAGCGGRGILSATLRDHCKDGTRCCTSTRSGEESVDTLLLLAIPRVNRVTRSRQQVVSCWLLARVRPPLRDLSAPSSRAS
jgi:hypothetical protein